MKRLLVIILGNRLCHHAAAVETSFPVARMRIIPQKINLKPMRGSAHRLRSAYNNFILCLSIENSLQTFRIDGQNSICVYLLEDKLYVISSEIQVFNVVNQNNGYFSLESAINNQFFSLNYATPLGEFLPDANRAVAGAWEVFALDDRPQVVGRERAIIDRIDAYTGNLQTLDLLSAMGDEISAMALAACMRAAPADAILPAVDSAITDARFASHLVRAFPDDYYAQAFSHLFQKRRPVDTEIALGGLWLTGLDSRTPALPFAVNCRARQRVQPNRKVCMLATLRNEAPYIVEWLAYHRSIGIERFFLYENDSQDGSRELVDQLARHGLIDIVHNIVQEGGNAQSTAYAHALSLRPDLLEYQWCVIIDLDEFLLLNVNAFDCIESYLDMIDGREADAVAINWVIFGPNGRLQRDHTRSVMDTFAWRQALPDQHIKSIVRPSQFFASTAHYPYKYRNEPFNFVDQSGQPYISTTQEKAWSLRPDESHAGLAHYVYKSLDEFLLKWSRNRGDNPRRVAATNQILSVAALEAFIGVFEERGLQSDIMATRSSKARAEAQKIRALPGISAIEAANEEIYIRTISGVREMFLDCPAVQSSKQGQNFRDLIIAAAERAEI